MLTVTVYLLVKQLSVTATGIIRDMMDHHAHTCRIILYESNSVRLACKNCCEFLMLCVSGKGQCGYIHLNSKLNK